MTPESKAIIDQHLKYMRYSNNALLIGIAFMFGYTIMGVRNKDIFAIIIGTESALFLLIFFLILYCARVIITTYLLTEAKDV